MDDATPAQAAPGEPEPIAYPIGKAPLATGITRTKIYEAIRAKELTVRKRGRSTIVEAAELRRWIKTFPTMGRAPDSEIAA